MSSEYLGAHGRLSRGPAEQLVRGAFAIETAAAPRLAAWLSLADLAHAVALVEGGALAGDDARDLLRGLLELHAIPGDEFPWDAALGDAFNSREAELRRRAGRRASGWLSAGRPRREAFRVGLRLAAHAGALDLEAAQLDLAAALVERAAETRADLAADYTYLQPAQPTTVGHLLLAYAYPALRDAARTRAVDGELARSVAGAGGSAGSRWPLDRRRLAELLGCTGVVEHAKDAAWQADVYVELLAALAVAATHQSQLAQDLEIYASQEFGLVELDDEHSRVSALMPQKKNPYALVALRTRASQAAGELTAALTALHTGSARTDHFHLLNGSVPAALGEALDVARLAAAVVARMQLHVERFAQVARTGLVTAADVADVLALRGGLDYRSAHTLVGRAVRMLVEEGRGDEGVDAATLATAAADLGLDVELDDDLLAEALDPARCAETRLQEGGSSQAALAAMLDGCGASIAGARAGLDERRTRRAAAERALIARAGELAAAG